MSWVSGIHDRLTSFSLKPATSVEPRALARMLPCVSTTPFGSLVEPEENWMKAVSSARHLLYAAGARDVIQVIDQESACRAAR